MFLRIFKHLLPNARAWNITGDKRLRQFFDGLTGVGEDFKAFADEVWLDIFPDTTREIEAWEAQFGLPDVLTDEQERRDRLDATWKALGGQSPRYIQDTLRNAGFDVFVHEWWEVPVVGSPVARSPLLVLNDGLSSIQYIASCGATTAVCGHADAVCGASVQPTGFALVNKLLEALSLTSCGNANMVCANPVAVCGAREAIYEPKQYIVPTDSTKWPYFLYIGGTTYPDHATVLSSRRNEFETLCLKICPTQVWIGLLIDYT